MKNNILNILFLFILVIVSCKKGTEAEKGTVKNPQLAKVYNKSLYLSDIADMFPEGSSRQDSLQTITAYTDRWIRENLMMHEAERNVPKDVNIEQMVSQYRESLILNLYEQKITETTLDSAISNEELRAFYDRNKDQYQLETPILKAYLIKVPTPVAEADSIQKWWNGAKNEQNKKKLMDYATKYKLKTFMLADSAWYRLDELADKLPNGTLTAENISKDKELTLKDDRFQYYFKTLNVMSKKEIAPFDYIKDQASKFILHERKIELLKKRKQELYDTEIQRNNVKIYNKK